MSTVIKYRCDICGREYRSQAEVKSSVEIQNGEYLGYGDVCKKCSRMIADFVLSLVKKPKDAKDDEGEMGRGDVGVESGRMGTGRGADGGV